MALDAREVIEDFLQSHDLDFDRTDNNTFMVTLPGENKLQTHCALIVGDHSLSINAFVIRKPDTHEDAVHKWCMAKNAAMYPLLKVCASLRPTACIILGNAWSF